jgi:ubiquinone/menaquinone biosynthesis C-methylase UbiE
MSAQTETEAHERSRAVWDEMAAGWEADRDEIWADSRAVGEWLVDKLAPQPGETVLEIAAGVGDTGFVAARLIGDEGRLLSTDFAPEMVAAARRRAAELGIANADFRVLDAEQMGLATDSVDGVICRWGYMLMANPAAAFAETRRVLQPGGKLAFSVWASPDANPWASLIARILIAQGHMAPPHPLAPGIFALADRQRVTDLVMEAGFAAPEFAEVPAHRRFANRTAFWRHLTELAGAISPILRGLSPTEQAAVRALLDDAAAPFTRDDGYDFPGLCLNAVTW